MLLVTSTEKQKFCIANKFLLVFILYIYLCIHSKSLCAIAYAPVPDIYLL
jgi:hypothetical protein